MATASMLMAALVILPAVGLVAWAFTVMARAEEDMRSVTGFDGLHFET